MLLEGPLRWPGVAIETPSLHFLKKMLYKDGISNAMVLKAYLELVVDSRCENLKAMHRVAIETPWG